MKKLIRTLYIIGGFLSLGLGWLGIILPILPTTPFLLLASFCFARGSEKFERWFVSTKIYKKYLENFVNSRAMTLKQKWTILLFADFMMLFPLILVDKLIVKIIIMVVILCKFYYFMFRVKTIKQDK